MSKRKLKTKTGLKLKTKPSAAGLRRRRAIIAGVVLAVLGGPASWLMVSAQSDVSLGATSTASDTSAAAAEVRGAHNRAKTNTASGDKAGQAAAAGTNKDRSKPDSGGQPTTDKTASKTPPAAASVPPAKPTPPPAAPTPAVTPTSLHSGIITTIFWVGESAGADNANITNTVSAWDESWQSHFGGVDNPAGRNGFLPAAFAPHENPFYFALPYNDFDDNGNRKSSGGSCANAAALAHNDDASWCKNTWIKIGHAGKTAYAQWEDVGPLQEDDTAYVFGSAAPKNTWGAKAGLDVSPAVRDYLGLQDVDSTSWSFVSAGSVPGGPWQQLVTTSLGT